MSEFEFTQTCRLCNNLKKKILLKVYKDGTSAYKDETGRRWWGNCCPDCTKHLRKKYDPYISLDPQMNCKWCKTEFIRASPAQKYCSKVCANAGDNHSNKLKRKQRRRAYKAKLKKNAQETFKEVYTGSITEIPLSEIKKITE